MLNAGSLMDITGYHGLAKSIVESRKVSVEGNLMRASLTWANADIDKAVDQITTIRPAWETFFNKAGGVRFYEQVKQVLSKPRPVTK